MSFIRPASSSKDLDKIQARRELAEEDAWYEEQEIVESQRMVLEDWFEAPF